MARLGLPPVHWNISGQPVILADWSANASDGSGFDQMRGVISSTDAKIMPQSIMQGSIISGWSEYGKVVFEGRLSAAPKIDQGGTATVVAQGRVSEARKRQSRLLFYTTNGNIFQDAAKPPFNRVTYTGGAASYGLTIVDSDPDGLGGLYANKGTISASLGGAVAGEAVQAFIYIPDGRIRRIRGFVQNFAGLDAVRIGVTESALAPAVTVAELLSGTTPEWAGALFSAGNNGFIDVQIPGNGFPGVVLGFVNHTGNTNISMHGIEVWGERLGDIIYSEEVAVGIADRLGWDDSGVQAVGGSDIRPMDWIGAWDQVIAYAAALDGVTWGVYEDERGYGPRLDYGKYGRRTWQVSSAGAAWDLQPLEIRNRVNVSYVSADERDQQYVLVADPDPLESVGLTTELRLDMNDRQAGFDLAARYATSVLDHASKQLYAGRISVVSAMDTKTGVDAPYEIRGGDLITISDFNGTDALTCHVSDVEYSAFGVEIGVEEPAVSFPSSARGVSSTPTSAPVSRAGQAIHSAQVDPWDIVNGIQGWDVLAGGVQGWDVIRMHQVGLDPWDVLRPYGRFSKY